MDVKGYCLCEDTNFCVIVTEYFVNYITLDVDGIKYVQFDRDPLMSAVNLYEIDDGIDGQPQEDKRFWSRYGEDENVTEELAVWNQKFELQYTIKVKKSHNGI